MEKILLDTDIGGDIDDAICLGYLLSEPKCNLLGITTVCGESEKRASVADAICRTTGKSVPIVAGLDISMQPIPVYPTPDGAAALKNWKHSEFTKGNAAEFLYKIIKDNSHEVTLIAIGNMTNIATLFQKYPDASGLLKGLFVMNGYFGTEKLPDPCWNWNSWADPSASGIVFGAAVALHRVIPLDVTDMLTIDAQSASKLLPANSPLMRAIFDFGNAWLTNSNKLTLHDPLAAISVFYPDICKFERGFVKVETKETERMGETRFTPDDNGNAEIARTVDKMYFYRILSETLRGVNNGIL